MTPTSIEIIDCIDAQPKPAVLARAYEVRAFGPRAELRWIRDGETGEAILIADSEIPTPGDDLPTIQPYLETLNRTYRIWGKPVEPPKGAAAQNWSA